MAPQEKAVELVNKYLQVYDGRVSFAKHCALIAVDEILQMGIMAQSGEWNMAKEYWKEVKEEIEKL